MTFLESLVPARPAPHVEYVLGGQGRSNARCFLVHDRVRNAFGRVRAEQAEHGRVLARWPCQVRYASRRWRME